MRRVRRKLAAIYKERGRGQCGKTEGLIRKIRSRFLQRQSCFGKFFARGKFVTTVKARCETIKWMKKAPWNDRAAFAIN